MRCIAAASPAAQILQPSAIVDATDCRDERCRREARPASRRCHVIRVSLPAPEAQALPVAGRPRCAPRRASWAASTPGAGRWRGSRSRPQPAGSQPRPDRCGSPDLAPTSPPRRRARLRLTHREAAPPSCTTICTSSSAATASNRRGVSVRITGRSPFESRNSFPVHTGTTKSARGAGGRSTRTLAAGSLSEKSDSSGPPSTTLIMCGVSGSTRRTTRPRNFGGSRRIRSVGSTGAR